MTIEANSPEEYISKVPEDRKEAMKKLRQTILKNLPKGFVEGINYNMIGYFVPHSLYPAGYHCDPKQPLPFINIASQKHFLAFYHMGMYANKKLLDWFTKEYPKHCKSKLDMGKSCVRFKKVEDIPYKLIGELVKKVSPAEWIKVYEANLKRK
jgi:uncharacterized protein YdhG (YjbR/CyaY superfamily)